MRSFLALLCTFVLVYLVTPWVMTVLLRWVHIGIPESIQSGFVILASVGIYSLLRKRFGDKIPRI